MCYGFAVTLFKASFPDYDGANNIIEHTCIKFVDNPSLFAWDILIDWLGVFMKTKKRGAGLY